MDNKYATILFIFLEIFTKVASQVSIIQKDFPSQQSCLSGTNGTWYSLDDGQAITNCNTSCYLNGDPTSQFGLVIDTRLTVSGNIVYSYNIGSFIQYAVVGVDILYYIDNGAYLKIDINSQVSQTFNPGSQSLYDDVNTLVCNGKQQYIQKASISLNRGQNQLTNNNLIITFSKIITSNPNTSILGIKSISIWLSCSINCKICTNQLNCQSCKNDFKLSTLPSGQIVCQQTQGCSNNCYLCAVSQSENICVQCKPGYQLSNNTCVLSSNLFICGQDQYFDYPYCQPYSFNCALYDSASQTYGNCSGQENLSQYKCPYYQFVLIYPDNNHSSYRCGCMTSNCFDCYPYGFCNSCEFGYSLSPTNTCGSVCNSNQYLNSNSICTGCGQNCIKCNQNGCLQCANSSYYIDPINQQNCLQCQIANCSICSSNGKCSICNSGYQLSQDFLSCQLPCTSPNCATCLQGSSTNCQTCISQYVVNPSTNQCISINSCIVANCQACVSQNPLACSTCSPNLSLNSNQSQCLPCSVANCSQCLSSNYQQCQKCVTGYYLSADQSQCNLCAVNNCATCQDNNYLLCKTCQSNYYISVDQKSCVACAVSNCNLCGTNLYECQSCNNNFYLTANKSQCLPCQVNNCQQCIGSYDKCQVCQNNYFLKADQSQCLPCSVNNCQQCIGSYSKCQSCQNNFYLTADQSQCLPCQVNNCQQCLGSYNKCQNCQNNFYLTADQLQCLTCQVNNCQQCDGAYNRCLKCFNNFLPNSDNTDCQICQVKNCQQCSSYNYNICQQCQQNYYLNSSQTQCQPCGVQNCKQCLANNYQACQICNNGYQISSDQLQCTLIIIPTPQQNSFQIKQQLLDNGYNITLNFQYQLQQNSLAQSQLLSIFSISISGFTQNQYTMTLQQQSNSTIIILINPSINIKNSKINVTIIDKSFSYQNSISVVTQTQDLIPYVYLSQSQVQAAQQIASVGQGISTSLISSIVPSVFFGNFYIVCNTLDITGFLYYLMFLNIRFPLNIMKFYELFKNFNFPFVPNLFSFIVDPNYYQESPPKFMEMNTDNYFLNNSGQYFTIYLAGFGLYLLAKIFAKTSIKYINSYCQRAIKETWEYGAIIDLSWSFYIYLVVGILIQFKTYNFDDKNSYVVNYTFHSLCFIIFFGIPFLYLYKIYKNQNISIDKDFQTKYSSLINGLKLPEISSYDKPLKENEVVDLQNDDFQTKSVKNENQFEVKNLAQIFNQKISEVPEELQTIELNNGKRYYTRNQTLRRKRTRFTAISPSLSEIRLKSFSSSLTNLLEGKKTIREQLIFKFSKYYNVVLYFRKILFCMVISFMYDYTYIQISFICVLNIFIIIYLSVVTPFKSNFENVQFIIQEVLMIAIQICASLLVKDSQDENEDTRMKIGWIIVAISGFLIAYFTIFIIKDLIVSIYQLVKSLVMYIKNKKSKSQVQPAILESSPVQLNKNMDQNIVNNNNLDKNLDNKEEIQSISIIYQTPNVQGEQQINSQKQINWQINRRKRNSVFSQSIYKSSHSLQSTQPSSKNIQKVEQQQSETNIYNINQNLDSTNRKRKSKYYFDSQQIIFNPDTERKE
ncbi:hypothetical protein TTHERM_00598660 (macronuclear) [Tetrahymena thermophila SB210]|uniref:EGF-like domain-containing protein n=1 Tax=Tetrahymena thermophila (strain SB210) TaxID=312017 RepID=Q232C7_TETTS|nr:hypothetical protein TTHERM_00598660 [Tetrahymena thermophila SB210]EAR91485.2 hypothetical protein TTHERM_00598660 [Tetrahymena thermophila SB210]|eukprot:XP_001011730.2 hypothetical protein TTHERM_00598660 [Tetrahymena thermophila SB210]